MSGWRSGASAKLAVTKADTAGVRNIGSSAGTSVSLTANSGTTAWSQYVASLSADMVITQVAVVITSGSLSTAGFPIYLEIGSGGAGSETTLSNVPLTVLTTGASAVFPLVVPQRISGAARVAIRLTDTNDSGNVLKFSLYGVPYANMEGN